MKWMFKLITSRVVIFWMGPVCPTVEIENLDPLPNAQRGMAFFLWEPQMGNRKSFGLAFEIH